MSKFGFDESKSGDRLRLGEKLDKLEKRMDKIEDRISDIVDYLEEIAWALEDQVRNNIKASTRHERQIEFIEEKLEDFDRHIQQEGELAHLSGCLGKEYYGPTNTYSDFFIPAPPHEEEKDE